MATSTGKTHCVTCGKDRVAYKCEGCLQSFCLNHLNEHNRTLSIELDELENQRNLFRQILTEQKTNPEKHSLIDEVNQWERDSITKIQERAEMSRQLVRQYIKKHTDTIETELCKFTEHLRNIREENDFNEIHLIRLKENSVKSSSISIQQESSSFISPIRVIVFSNGKIDTNLRWKQNGITVFGRNELKWPWGMCIDDSNQSIIVADTGNNRIVEWKIGETSGKVIAGNNGQLNSPRSVILHRDQNNDCLIIGDCGNRRVVRWPRRNDTTAETILSNVSCHGLAMDRDGNLYIADSDKHEVRRWKIGDANGTIVAGGNGSGTRLDQLKNPYGIAVDQNFSVYVSDYENHRVVKWTKDAKVGIVVAGGQGQGYHLNQLSYPCGIIVDELGTLYVADYGNNRVVRWLKETAQGDVIVRQPNALSLSFDQHGNLYVLDYSNNTVQKFETDRN
ncbi:unnamed protein product [Adineta ricciae]|uniref:Uncharacterized protein n=2 Tax=Adineta ricciae TaxID=249248 RepID=A0A814WXL6_ADIRI|nr:unnamed protein product [Adineta ricciae]